MHRKILVLVFIRDLCFYSYKVPGIQNNPFLCCCFFCVVVVVFFVFFVVLLLFLHSEFLFSISKLLLMIGFVLNTLQSSGLNGRHSITKNAVSM